MLLHGALKGNLSHRIKIPEPLHGPITWTLKFKLDVKFN